MIWGCHSFGGVHAIFSAHGSNGKIETRLKIIWRILTTPGIIGFVYSQDYGKSNYIESKIESMSNYGIVHGDMNYEQHNYYRNEDVVLEDEVKMKLEADLIYYKERQEKLKDWFEFNSKCLELGLEATKAILNEDKEVK